LDTVSTGSGSDLVSDQHAILLTILTPLVDQVATAPCTDPIQVRSCFLAKPAKAQRSSSSLREISARLRNTSQLPL
jgi:hypothetical protein